MEMSDVLTPKTTMQYQTISVEQAGRVLTVGIDNPPRNFLSNALAADLTDLVRALEKDHTVGAVVLTGRQPGVFVTHADTRELLQGSKAAPAATYRQVKTTSAVIRGLRRIPGFDRALRRTPLAGIGTLQRLDELFLRMNRLDKVLIAAINGLALGGGTILALACDLRLIADTDHPIGLIESGLGFLAAAGGTQRLVRSLGAGQAMEILLEGETLSPRRAIQLGLVHEIVAAEELVTRAQARAARLARRSPLVVREIKRVVYDAGSRPIEQAIRIEEAGMLTTIASPASIRAMEAYHESVGSFDTATERQILDAWQRLYEGELLQMWSDDRQRRLAGHPEAPGSPTTQQRPDNRSRRS
jgi:enoyl-CoA hydratase